MIDARRMSPAWIVLPPPPMFYTWIPCPSSCSPLPSRQGQPSQLSIGQYEAQLNIRKRKENHLDYVYSTRAPTQIIIVQVVGGGG